MPLAKPAPDLYLATLAELGLDASEVIAFEDSINGSLAAKWAAIFFRGGTPAFMRTDNFEHVVLWLDSLEDAPPAQSLERVAAQQEKTIP